MILVIYQMDVLAEKQKEFVQAISMILQAASKQPGYQSRQLCRDTADENRFFLIENWENQPKLDTYWKGDQYGAFLGAFHLLKNPPGVQIHAVTYTAGMEAVEAARTKALSANEEKENKVEGL